MCVRIKIQKIRFMFLTKNVADIYLVIVKCNVPSISWPCSPSDLKETSIPSTTKHPQTAAMRVFFYI